MNLKKAKKLQPENFRKCLLLMGYIFLNVSGKKSAGPCPSSDTWMYKIGERKWAKVASCPNARIFPEISLLPNSTESLSIVVLFGGMETGRQVVKVVKTNFPL